MEEPVADAFTAQFVAQARELHVGDPRDPATVVGPLINEWALRRVGRRVDEAVQKGAVLLAGGQAAPPRYPPTVLTDVPVDCELGREETFGPVAILETMRDAEEALCRADDSQWALSAGIMTRDESRGLRLATRLDAGMVHVNDQPVNDEPHMPFGGSRSSGWGRFGTGPGGDDFTETQLVTTREPRAARSPDRCPVHPANGSGPHARSTWRVVGGDETPLTWISCAGSNVRYALTSSSTSSLTSKLA